MKKVIFQRFMFVLILALLLSGSIFGVVIGRIILDQTEQDMLYTVKIADHGLDYHKELKPQLEELKKIQRKDQTRFTVVDLEGNVIADSEVDDISQMESHADRDEIRMAKETGSGYSTRRSGTLKMSMLYVATLSENGSFILRMAVPFSGLEEYIGILVPAFLISIGITLGVSIVLSDRFARSVTKPLNEIAEEMQKLKEENPDFHFNQYQYEEMNVIADTTLKMSQAVKESMKRIEFEKMIRQEFFSNASHELKTPLTSIRGYLELLENDMAADENMKRNFMARIQKETVNMTNLINDILMISRLETKEAEVLLTQIRISPLVMEVCSSLEPLAKEYQVTLSLNCKPFTIYANAQQLRELLNNLIINAIKYNKPEGKVMVNITAEHKEAVITVEDTGVGIPEESKQRIFERFYRVDKGRSKKVGGTGLGLSIVKHIVGYYNGSIEFESKLMEGSKFTVRLPLNRNES